MHEKPTFASVTDIACTCGYLERTSQQADMPIKFDARVNEFSFRYEAEYGEGQLIIYHCPFCGGAAPKSRRGTFFAVISQTEVQRLSQLVGTFKTLEEAIEQLGPPDSDFPAGSSVTEPEKDGRPPTTRVSRTLVYRHLSSAADVYLADHHRETIGISFQGKHLESDEPKEEGSHPDPV